jgi:tRNA-specific 2-thiouridylase
MNSIVAVAMSGGLDSSAAAALLQDKGYEVIGLTAKTWPSGSRCCSDEDIHRAKRVAAHLGIPHYVVELSEPFESRVVRYFADEYAAGRTPSPCVVCNRYIKFGELLEKSAALGASRLATGHYARIVGSSEGHWNLLRGVDREKDQSYFLFDLAQETLARVLLPLGNMKKEEAKLVALQRDLPVFDRRESQDLCFVEPGGHWRLAEQYRPDVCREGKLVDRNGRILGEHSGVHRFTIGQRKGLGVAAGHRLYVSRLDAENNTVLLSERKDLFSDRLVAERVRWTDGIVRREPFSAHTRIRYNHEPALSVVMPLDDGSVEVCFKEGQFAVTPGQAAAFYGEDKLFGGGWIACSQQEEGER